VRELKIFISLCGGRSESEKETKWELCACAYSWATLLLGWYIKEGCGPPKKGCFVADDDIYKVDEALLWFIARMFGSMCHRFNEGVVRDRVTRVVLLWVNNHFTDFETDPAMMEFLETFEMGLEREKMQGQLRLLNIACAAKARTRNVTLARPSRDEVLHFSILGGYERGFGIFISKVGLVKY
jgi:hypothetical protein